EWTDVQVRELQDHFVELVYAGSREVFDPLHAQKKVVTDQRDKLKDAIPSTLIYREAKDPVQAFVLDRGLYDQPGEPVDRGVPSSLPPLPDDLANDRLALARWLFSGQHPLAARVAVNRFWQQVFGTGIVTTTEDFGAQGTFPSHPDLLDYLAVEFVERNWDVKWLMKQMVMSATYRQQSSTSPELLQSDPVNSYLTRGRRYRLDAEVLRDQALAVSGLLVPTIGGPSVKPPQPDGLWFAVGYSGSNTVRFEKDAGHDKVHRRSMYTFWKRTAPPPQMSLLDAPSREVCQVRRERTNTPLQALMLMNDPQYVEAARYFAQRAIDESDDDTETRIQWLFAQALARKATAKELEIFDGSVQEWTTAFTAEPEAAKKLIAIGETPATDEYDAADLATWTMAANLLMNMDEFVTKN
ncbi:MAG: DUF1553 domain-containing protein, partial [Pirellulaceae bacterium]